MDSSFETSLMAFKLVPKLGWSVVADVAPVAVGNTSTKEASDVLAQMECDVCGHAIFSDDVIYGWLQVVCCTGSCKGSRESSSVILGRSKSKLRRHLRFKFLVAAATMPAHRNSAL